YQLRKLFRSCRWRCTRKREVLSESRMREICLCAPLSRGVSGTFGDLDRLLVTDLGARSSLVAAKRCAKGAGLEGAPKSVTSSKRSQIFVLCRRYSSFV